ncbi:MAG: class I tRNA ligase family protein, partial [Acidimicrobiia bacterium]|nr:class I tRNA ligase family protein [Acidimicrobiia bacterium]
AENAAMERKVHPGKWTYDNIATMRAQLKSMGLAIDWSREFATCDPSYYGHEQRMFIEFYRDGLVERKVSVVNWDPVDQTVLANEQVIDGKGWRSGAPVEKRELAQWFLKISDFSEELLSALDTLTDWPEKVRLMQRNWIGKSEGLRFSFALEDAQGNLLDERLTVYTTRHDTIFGAS